VSFIANPKARTTEADTISNDGFWPDISLLHAREVMRLDGKVTDGRLRHALITAIVEVDRDLSGWRASRQAQGIERLEDVTGRMIDGKPMPLHCYLRAVYSLAKADLIERMADFDLAKGGETTVSALQDSPDEHRRDASWAITALLGQTRVTVELI